ncbi:MsnO8 family LLM class oxidoreductase [Nocardioides sp. dk4132]|uniref:MsnO8 family LLM class oxidoreductase n=1 Tax=unclassified Nocardioides TaxID=2615069 RepID=UPI001294E26F|nr:MULTISPECIES: MsnO8 family LLM class oxidoreductase [unclassified Nocardioides]MQW76308.1 MsnO8 family LLM class oxidoreductase [Nocardioides sp. dk4132]QGA07409.1 MsnO8 family LLM class oxidoreductase [Nocardioides sp. dk884]
MKLSIVDLGTVAPGTSESDALADSLAVTRHAEQLGFHRVWFAEHHLSRSGASHHPELLIAAAAAQTSRIRLGSGAVLMNHYSPFKVAELFQQLEAMAPGRVDLGMGRATAGPVIDLALQQDRHSRLQPNHHQQVLETLTWLYGTFPEDHAFAGNPLMPTVPHVPQTWLLGSSPNGSNLAAGLGIGYTLAGFINPPGAAPSLRHYRESFRPQGFGLESPRAILAVNVSVGETESDGERLVGSAKGFYARLGRMGGGATVPSADEAASELTPAQQAEPTSITDGQWPRFVAGGPDEVRATLEQMLEESGADELTIQNLIADPADRMRSHELLAQIVGLKPADAAVMDSRR